MEKQLEKFKKKFIIIMEGIGILNNNCSSNPRGKFKQLSYNYKPKCDEIG
ncbi:MAG: hypothetical protein GF308_13405 [Candidatus Heimdallarchaeota archaeon]|nr:hypothetical protein [Candidatus Heimdallarchaeota archaeon]